MLGLDALSSAAYGPEAALSILMPLGMIGLVYIGPITVSILALLLILFLSYRQVIAAYPHGGGAYTVARENLATGAGLLAAASLMLDYVLNAAVGISAGVGALVSAIPKLQPHILALCLTILVVITLVNLRGTRESGISFAVPTYSFIACLLITIAIGVWRTLASGGHPVPVVHPPSLRSATEAVSYWLILKAFSSGCTAMTGVEAISNGVTVFTPPPERGARHTLAAIVTILGLLLAGVAFLCRVYGIGATDPTAPGYQSVLSQIVAAVTGRGVFYYVTVTSIVAVLCLSANTSFAGFPRLCQLIAKDSYLPHAFAELGRRLVYSAGIVILASLAAVLLIIFRGITDRLIPLFAIGALGAFTLSQAGMVVHWRRQWKRGDFRIGTALATNALGAAATSLALVIVLVTKFTSGAWITLLLIPSMIILFQRVRRHYVKLRAETRSATPLDVGALTPPVVVVPIKGWDNVTKRGLRFALHLSQDIVAVHIERTEGDGKDLESNWGKLVDEPTRAAGMTSPKLQVLPSPYRKVASPLLDFIDKAKRDYPDRLIAVIIPELVETRWYQILLHHQRATVLKAKLLLEGDERVIVINVPRYVEQLESGKPV
jgi:amino acid transporter